VARGLFFWLVFALAADASARPAPPSSDARAGAVFERTKQARATYALYSWNWVKEAGSGAGLQWAAEFHRGSLHRVETPNIRVVADCAAGTGTMLQVDSGETRSGPGIAGAACGINSNFQIRRLQWLGRKATRFGPLERLRILDPANERLYAVDRDGILVAAEIFPRDGAGGGCLQQEPLALEKTLPAQNIFSEESLGKSFAAPRFRSPPKAYSGDLWLGSRRCV
jgi:hypothetical protein